MMARHFHIGPTDVDRMELWQVIACLLPEQVEEVPVAVGPVAMRPIDVNKARLAAHARGEELTGTALFGTPVPVR